MKSSAIRNKKYYPLVTTESSSDMINTENIKIKQNELKKCELAIQRLTDLYLFSEAAISKEEYLVKKQELEEKKNLIKLELPL